MHAHDKIYAFCVHELPPGLHIALFRVRKRILIRARHEHIDSLRLKRIPHCKSHSQVQPGLHHARFASHRTAVNAPMSRIHHDCVSMRGRLRACRLHTRCLRTGCLRTGCLRRRSTAFQHPRAKYAYDTHKYPHQQCVARVPEPRICLPLPHKITSW